MLLRRVSFRILTGDAKVAEEFRILGRITYRLTFVGRLIGNECGLSEMYSPSFKEAWIQYCRSLLCRWIYDGFLAVNKDICSGAWHLVDSCITFSYEQGNSQANPQNEIETVSVPWWDANHCMRNDLTATCTLKSETHPGHPLHYVARARVEITTWR